MQVLVWHLIVSHPDLQINKTKWQFLKKILNKNKAIFLDRDGTLNHAHIKNNDKNEFKLRPPYQLKEFRLFGDIKFLNRYSQDYLLIILSNS